MDITSSSELLKNIRMQDLAEYLEMSGWENVESPKASWLVYTGPDDYDGEPLEIVLSKKIGTRTSYDYYASAVNLLSALRHENPDIIVQRIENVNRDVLNVRNTEDSFSIPLKLAARQVPKLQTLVKQATNSERDALPYYRSDYSNSLANRMADEFQFAHTTQRSFGLVVQSPVLPKPIEYRQLGFGFYEEDSEPLEPLAPVERRIMERIVRGLIATKKAVRQENIEALVNSYHSGFNGNMCKAIVDISRNKATSVEYSVLWSPKIRPPEDIAETESILLNEIDYAYLSRAVEQMKDLEANDTFIVRGLVKGVSSDDDPFKPDANRSVVIGWNNKPDTSRVIQIIAELEPSDYMQALDAHKAWQPIEVTGEAKLMGNRWRLLNPRNFRVV